MRALAVVGAGHDQLDTYRVAHRAGLATIGFDGRADAPASGVADTFHAVDVRDAERIIELLDGADVAGVVAPAVDRGLPTVRRVALALGLPCPVSELAATCSVDKTAFRSLVDRVGLPGYRSVEIDPSALAEVPPESLDVPLPAVVKPVDSSGSKGVSVVTAPWELSGAVSRAAVHATTGRVLVEEMLDGRHLTAELFLAAGRIAVMVLSERVHTGPPGMITLAQKLPATVTGSEREAVADAVHRIAAAVDLLDGPVNLDLVMAADGTPRVIEMAARLGGNGLPRLLQLSTGVDTVRAGIDLAIGAVPDLRPSGDRAVVLLILATDRSGTVTRIDVPDAVSGHPSVADVEVLVEVGQRVRPYDQAANKLGYLSVVADDEPAAVGRLARDLAARIEIELVDDDGRRAPCTWRML